MIRNVSTLLIKIGVRKVYDEATISPVFYIDDGLTLIFLSLFCLNLMAVRLSLFIRKKKQNIVKRLIMD